ncbi:MAG: hypothetical protein M3P98_03255 [bacterium]|nr:hypothetical protein [bacterium]
MSNPITGEAINEMYLELHQYDVVENLWAFNDAGLLGNMTHVVHHLTKGDLKKDFNDPNVMQTEVVPDDIQYALRMARWCSFFPEEVKPPADSKITIDAGILKHNVKAPTISMAHRWTARSLLATIAHDSEHSILTGGNMIRDPGTEKDIAKHLFRAATLDAKTYEFDPIEAFYTRLAYLRRIYSKK